MAEKRTHKLRALGNVDAVILASSTAAEACKRLGINVSTLRRWIKSGKAVAPRGHQKNGATAAEANPTVDESPDAWAARVRDRHELSDTDAVLLTLAVAALTMARTEKHPAVKLSAMGRFQQLVRQLPLGVVESEKQQTVPVRTSRIAAPHRADPRAVLMAVK